MAENDIGSLTINMVLILVVLMGLISFYIILVNNEGRGEIFDAHPQIESFNLNLTRQYTDNVVNVANINANLSAFYNPELAISAADQSGNAMALNKQNLFTNTWNSLSLFGSIILGSIWTTVISGLIIALLTVRYSYLFIKWIRSGT